MVSKIEKDGLNWYLDLLVVGIPIVKYWELIAVTRKELGIQLLVADQITVPQQGEIGRVLILSNKMRKNKAAAHLKQLQSLDGCLFELQCAEIRLTCPNMVFVARVW